MTLIVKGDYDVNPLTGDRPLRRRPEPSLGLLSLQSDWIKLIANGAVCWFAPEEIEHSADHFTHGELRDGTRRRKKTSEISSNGDGTCWVRLSLVYEAIIDERDREIVAPFNWTPLWSRSNRADLIYAVADDNIFMHRLIMRPPEGFQVDHIDLNTLNNRRSNLRLATPKQNTANRRKPLTQNSSQFKGVAKSGKKWKAVIYSNRHANYLGTFDTEREAAAAYDAAAKAMHGEFSRPNLEANAHLIAS